MVAAVLSAIAAIITGHGRHLVNVDILIVGRCLLWRLMREIFVSMIAFSDVPGDKGPLRVESTDREASVSCLINLKAKRP